MSGRNNDFKKCDIYTEYYKITGMWWAKWCDILGPLRDRLNNRRGDEGRTCINNGFERWIADDYVKISYDAKKYRKYPDAKNLRCLIYDYLQIFDFLNAFYYIDRYIESKYHNYKKYQRMKCRLKNFLHRIKDELKKREDIIVFWTDNVSYNELDWLPKLQEKGRNALFFDNAYTPTPYTRCVMSAMSNKWLNIDDFGKDDLKDQNINNSILLRKVHGYGYEPKYFGHGKGPCVFDEKIRHFNRRQRDSSCKTCFSAINELIHSQKKQFMIIHTVWETHPPYWYPDKNGRKLIELFGYENGELEKQTGRVYGQIRGAAAYWDEQLDFYSGLFGERSTKIYMSDHGKEYRQYQLKEWVEATNHIIFLLQSRYAANGVENRLFTLENFTELIEAVMRAHQTGREIDLEQVFETPFMRVQKVDTYNKILVQSLKAIHCEEGGQAYRGIRTLEDYYLRFRDRELYYRNGDEETNLIDDPKYADRIEELRALAGDYFINIDKNEKFKYARELYH